jgi:hypothetical protein
VGQDGTEAQKTALVIATSHGYQPDNTCVGMSAKGQLLT